MRSLGPRALVNDDELVELETQPSLATSPTWLVEKDVELAPVAVYFVAAGDDVVAVGIGTGGVALFVGATRAPRCPGFLNADDVEVLVAKAGHGGLEFVDIRISYVRPLLRLPTSLDVE
eukprot:329694-Pyramimonas_sp.AAC.1